MPKIRLLGFVDVPGVLTAGMGEIVEVTPENETLASQLILQRGAVTVPEPKTEATTKVTAGGTTNDSDDDGEGGGDAGLNPADPTSKLSEFGIHGRYVKALETAGHTTIGAIPRDALASIAGISDAAAKAIAAVLTEELDAE